MTGLQVTAFGAIAATVILVPGPDMALTLRNTLNRGRRAGTATAAGVAAGQLVWAAAAAGGTTTALAAYPMASRIVRIVGAAYLLLLGLASARSAGRGGAAPQAAGRRPPVRRRGGFRQGLLSNLANPKMAAFFTALLPQFVVGRGRVLLTMLALGLVFSVMTFGWLCLCATTAARAAPLLRREVVHRALDGVCAVVFVTLAVSLIFGPDALGRL